MKTKTAQLLPVLLPVFSGFFIMGFADVVGITSTYVKEDFNLSDTSANILPLMVFLWFAVFSIPTGLIMNSIGRRKTVVISMFVTLAAMLVPLIAYRFIVVLIAFALLGIGNTILQVSLNPLLSTIVCSNRLTSNLTLGQFIKAIASFLGPIIAGLAVTRFDNWKYIFPLFALITIISTLWLWLTPIAEVPSKNESSSFTKSLGLLNDKTILILFLGIILVVGIDVGLNTTIPRYIMERCNIPRETAGLGTSLYFAARIIGTFAGAVLLTKISGRSFFITSMIIAVISMSVIIIFGNIWSILTMIFITGLAIANVFSIIFSMALKRMPDSTNEMSGLMIMGVAGGAFIPVLMGLVSDFTGTQAGGLLLLVFAAVYLLFSAVKVNAIPC